jgi:cobalamin biosynthesis protein CbiD
MADPVSQKARLEQMNQILDHIRANLKNIRNTWGERSPQYVSAVEILERALVENARRLDLEFEGKELERLVGRMTLEEEDG